MEKENQEMCIKNDIINKEFNFIIKFKSDGESFQNIMEKILINKIN